MEAPSVADAVACAVARAHVHCAPAFLAVQMVAPRMWSVLVGYNFTTGSANQVQGFAAVSASLSGLGARTDIAPLPAFAPGSNLQLRVFVGEKTTQMLF